MQKHSVPGQVFTLLTKTGKGFTNDQLAAKVGTSREAIRVAVRAIRQTGTPVVKKVTYDKRTNKMNVAKYFIPVSQDITTLEDCPRGRPSRKFAVPA
jgi:biotin operon repressor